MIIADYHVHSNFSSDGKASMEQMVERALELGLKKLCFTDHMDYDYPAVSEYNFEFNMESYQLKLSELKDKYLGKLEILTGVELGLQPHLVDRLVSLTERYPLDFIIGSSHVVDHYDPYFPEYWVGKTEEEGIYRYFQSIIENCKAFQGFHVYGHLDYIVRYTPSMKALKMSKQMNSILPITANGELSTPLSNQATYTSYSYPQFADILDEVLKTILSFGKGIEVNTAGFKYGLGHPHPKAELLKRYRELGGELITIGSDAHMPEHLCYDFDHISDLLLNLGFRYYTTFIQGAPIMHRL
ncbi:MAG TPA: histidinol-phosphatase HisJ family protein [Mobilitalea sp.]|nr:histidinol-phosphatase HisJ family protein [Mobilitalea sp.]